MHGKEITLSQVISYIKEKYEILGDVDSAGEALLIPAFIGDANINSITYCPNNLRNQLELIDNCEARVIFCSNTLNINAMKNKVIISVANPKLSFVRMMQKHYPNEIQPGIDPTAIVDKQADIHTTVHIGPYCKIGRCKIGEGTVIDTNVYIHADTIIGSNCNVNSGVVIGVEGTDFTKDDNGEYISFPHIAGTIIKDNVWIGSNTTIMRGVLRDTVIGHGTVIGHLCYIGHQVVIGDHCLILTDSIIGGSTNIGNDARISIGSCVINGVTIGCNVLIGMGSVVTQSVEDGWVAYGVPAKQVRKL